MLVLANTKLVARLLASDFPSENPRPLTRNFPYTNTLGIIKMKTLNTFYIKEVDKWDFYSIICYLIVTVIIYVDPYNFLKKEIILGYAYLTPLFLYMFNYKSLRKLNVWFIWIGISLSHIILHSQIGNIDKFQYYRGPASDFLKYTWIFLLLFQLLRIVSLRFQKIELVAPNRGSLDIWDNRKLTLVDNVCFIIYYGVFILIGVFNEIWS